MTKQLRAIMAPSLAGQRVHFNGIGGKGIAPAASLALAAQMQVTGDDLIANHRTTVLTERGARVQIGANQVPTEAEIVVSSAALVPAQEHPQAQRRMTRLEFVQHILDAHGSDTIAVAGSLGKSTAAALTHRVLSAEDPSAYIGADVPGLVCGGSLRPSRWAVVEACEYRAAYHALTAQIVIALNLVQNHEDDLGSGTTGFEHSLAAFLTQPTGIGPELAVLPAPVSQLLAPHLETAGIGRLRIETIGDDADWSVTIVEACPEGTVFRLAHHGIVAGTWTVPAPGEHLVTAAACALIVSLHLGVSHADSMAGLAQFRLPERRMSVVHSDERLVLIDDNARQPGQAAALLQALRQRYPRHRIVTAVAPWGCKNKRDLRTWTLGLREADTVWVLPVGAAAAPHGQEDPDADRRLAQLIRLEGTSAYVVTSQTDLIDVLPARDYPCPIVIATLGYDASSHAFKHLQARAAAAFAVAPLEHLS